MVNLESVDRDKIVFSWTNTGSFCHDVLYEIMTNCSSCPPSTQSLSVTCNINALESTMCSFAIRTVACADQVVTGSDTIFFRLKGELCVGHNKK